MNRPELILISGLPASGKTSFARYASRRLGLAMISKDSIKELLFDSIGFHNREEKVRLNQAAQELLFFCAGKLLGNGDSVILENNFESNALPGLRKMAAAYDCLVINVIFTADEAVLYQRFLARNADPQRHRGHVINTEYPEKDESRRIPAPPEQAAFMADLRRRGMFDFAFGSHIMRVDSSDFSTVDYEDLVTQIRACRT